MKLYQLFVSCQHDERFIDQTVDVAQMLDGDVTFTFSLIIIRLKKVSKVLYCVVAVFV